MNINSLLLIRLAAIPLALILIVFPAVALLIIPTVSESSFPYSSVGVLLRTFYWSIGVAVVATMIGWPVGVRIATFRRQTYFVFILVLLMSLAIPAYAVYYAWWQAWPAGSWLHNYIVEHELLSFATKSCAFVALVGWSWPIPALICAMNNRSANILQSLHVLDGASVLQRFVHRIRVERRSLVLAILLVASITTGNTTCFDLAQIHTVGNELRAVVAGGGSILNAPWLSFAGVAVALVAALILFQGKMYKQKQSAVFNRSSKPVLILWFMFTCLPLLVGALFSIRNDGLQLWKQYGGDLFVSAQIGVSTSLLVCLIAFVSASLYISQSSKIKIFANIFTISWIFTAFLPASIVSFAVGNLWNQLDFDAVQRTPVILIFAQTARIGFVGALAGRWVTSCQQTVTLQQLNPVPSVPLFVQALRSRLVQAMCVVFAISIAMSFAEVSLTTQLAPPSTNQPIAVALLNAMHYQRPQIVTSAILVMLVIASVGALSILILQKKHFFVVVVGCFLISCSSNEDAPKSQATSVGSAGYSDGHFITPRAIDGNKDFIAVIDKSGRLQRFNHKGKFISSWNLELSGTGFPTGLSYDKEGNLWIADTHQNRILVLDEQGDELLSFGEYGLDEGQFLYPTDIAFGNDGEVYVSEYGGNDRITVFDKQGAFIRVIGKHGTGENEFRRPQSIAIDDKGDLYVADSGNHRIVVMHPSGEVIRIISSVGRGESELLYPYGILFDTPDTFIVCEFGNNRLQRFSRQGEPLGTWGNAGDGIGDLRTPWGIALTKDGFVVADTGNNRLQLSPCIMMTK